MQKTTETKSLLDMKSGAIKERVDYEMKKIIDNILDPNTDPTAKRKLKLTVEFIPSGDREDVIFRTEVTSNLAPTVKISSQLVFAKTGDGVMVYEPTAQVPGQLNADGEEQSEPAILKLMA
ncbi:MAG: hypothetical protein LBT88_08165 [Oscillospiraceae bacterium]|jgi:hypothetical protein|nr:hypothetical protein [Oscillospiraceae bacterium]